MAYAFSRSGQHLKNKADDPSDEANVPSLSSRPKNIRNPRAPLPIHNKHDRPLFRRHVVLGNTQPSAVAPHEMLTSVSEPHYEKEYVGTAAKACFFKMYREFNSWGDRNFGRPQSPRSRYLQHCIRQGLPPEPLGVVRPFPERVLHHGSHRGRVDLSAYGVGDRRAALIANPLQELPGIESVVLHSNGLSPRGTSAILDHLNNSIEQLDISGNAIGGRAGAINGGSDLLQTVSRGGSRQQRVLEVQENARRHKGWGLVHPLPEIDAPEDESDSEEPMLWQAVTPADIQSGSNMSLLSMPSTDLAVGQTLNGAVPNLMRLLHRPRLHLMDLNLEGVKLGNRGTVELCDALTHGGARLLRLNLACNGIGERGGKALGRMLSEYCTLMDLSLSWNSLRGLGSVALMQGLNKNDVLERLNLSWNCVGEGGLRNSSNAERIENIETIGVALATNQTLVHLDLSHNELGTLQCAKLASALQTNHTLLGLHLAGNLARVDRYGFVVPLHRARAAAHDPSRPPVPRPRGWSRGLHRTMRPSPSAAAPFLHQNPRAVAGVITDQLTLADDSAMLGAAHINITEHMPRKLKHVHASRSPSSPLCNRTWLDAPPPRIAVSTAHGRMGSRNKSGRQSKRSSFGKHDRLGERRRDIHGPCWVCDGWSETHLVYAWTQEHASEVPPGVVSVHLSCFNFEPEPMVPLPKDAVTEGTMVAAVTKAVAEIYGQPPTDSTVFWNARMLPPGEVQYFFMVDGAPKVASGQRLAAKSSTEGGLRINAMTVRERESPLFAAFAPPRPLELHGYLPKAKQSSSSIENTHSKDAPSKAAKFSSNDKNAMPLKRKRRAAANDNIAATSAAAVKAAIEIAAKERENTAVTKTAAVIEFDWSSAGFEKRLKEKKRAIARQNIGNNGVLNNHRNITDQHSLSKSGSDDLKQSQYTSKHFSNPGDSNGNNRERLDTPSSYSNGSSSKGPWRPRCSSSRSSDSDRFSDMCAFDPEDSVFAARASEWDSKSFHETEEVYDQALQSDLFQSKVRRIVRPEGSIVGLQNIFNGIRSTYPLLVTLFKGYCASSMSRDISCLGLNGFTSFTRDFALTDKKLNQGLMDNLFIAVNVPPPPYIHNDTKPCLISPAFPKGIYMVGDSKHGPKSVNSKAGSGKAQGNDVDTLTRFEFIEAIVRIAASFDVVKRFPGIVAEKGRELGPGDACKLLCDTLIAGHPMSPSDINIFRRDELYSFPVDATYETLLPRLQDAFERHSAAHLLFGERRTCRKMAMIEFCEFGRDSGLLDNEMPEEKFRTALVQSTHVSIGSPSASMQGRQSEAISLSFTDFLEALARVVDKRTTMPDDRLLHTVDARDGVSRPGSRSSTPGKAGSRTSTPGSRRGSLSKFKDISAGAALTAFAEAAGNVKLGVDANQECMLSKEVTLSSTTTPKNEKLIDDGKIMAERPASRLSSGSRGAVRPGSMDRPRSHSRGRRSNLAALDDSEELGFERASLGGLSLGEKLDVILPVALALDELRGRRRTRAGTPKKKER